VRYTPHCTWQEGPQTIPPDPTALIRKSKFVHMIKDAQRYLPGLAKAHYRSSIWEIKTVLPQSEFNDSRPILFKRHEELNGLISVMGGKIDNIYDLDVELSRLDQGGESCLLPTISSQS
jgi:hypothetical protein